METAYSSPHDTGTRILFQRGPFALAIETFLFILMASFQFQFGNHLVFDGSRGGFYTVLP